MSVRHFLRILCALALGLIATGEAFAERRVALVVGNAKYEHAGVLANTLNDANAIAALLTKAGFDVVDERRDVGVVEFKRAIREFLSAAATADIAVVFYSGHGIEIGGVNYLVPVDAKLVNDEDVEDEAIPLDRLIASTQSAKLLSLVILDACRNSPFTRSPGRKAAEPPVASAGPTPGSRSMGNPLGSVEQPGANTLVAYAAKAGSVSYDGDGPDSPFTTALLKYIAEPGLDIRIALGKVRDDVMASTGNRQEPFVYGSIGGADISLVAVPDAAKGSAATNVGAQNSIAADYEMAERVGTRWAWVAFLSAHGATSFYSNLARAQLQKLVSADPGATVGPPDTPAAASPSKPPPPPAIAPPPIPQPAKDEVAASKAGQLQAALPVSRPVTGGSIAPDPTCKAEEAKLKQLRLDPGVEQVIKFARELTCESLRPELNRLMESVGADARAEPVAAIPAPAALKGAELAAACKAEASELSRIRANPNKDAAATLSRDLKCENLRPQIARLLESVGN